ncbi:exodeoxyribonuclease V subunit beta [Blochmannia endosymbiont of Camponotus (Colobopsis) obliquus]|uniref:exodeoxyribonuclease V subunit beta n=1 Tax=Blochmannia endosymbiont of Camponotus (Colobopsis) obliquus TaxID=1505597 RepID=UPI00061A5B6B|nr:exodeoxyribonuclease V subunit beta [Blochmannia endosymbiont of Camponotus (Colobopsis) obliquus]AKC60434.1 Exodeoxyribonuclease V beta chain [Blochmannia endosymbiont of Camponotus (Colobopsis) obliquus]
MNINIQNLDPLTLPLYGSHLIEASAGTGKSYTLIIIYLRLILGLKHDTSLFKPLSVKEILVVTFTKITADNLRNKIKRKIHQLKIACLCGYSTCSMSSKLLIKIQNINLAISLLSRAEEEINQAAICTIHSFCQRIITQYPLESGTLFKFSLLENEINLYHEICKDFWRRYCYPLPIEVISIISSYWTNPEQLMNNVLPYLQGELPTIHYYLYEKNIDILTHHKNIIALIEKIKKKWHTSQNIINIVTKHLKTHCNDYDNKKISNLLKIINRWANEKTINYKIPKELKIFKTSKIKTIITDNQNIITHELFNSIEKIFLYPPSLKSYILIQVIKKIRKIAYQEKKIRTEIGFNDLINLVHNMLLDKKNKKLIQLIRKQYPITLIDEFQDTNTQQYHIFNMIYNHNNYNNSKNGLILIGDPKQAIYTFRGADIFTYICAKKKIKSHYTLNINWRSSTNINNAINQLFKSKKSPFIFKEIPFHSIQSTAHNDQLKLIINKKIQPAMCLWLNPVKTIKINEYKKIMAQQCAVTLTKLINHTQKNNAWLANKKYCQLLKTSDIAIIVRDRNEASIIRYYLSQFKISTIYLSNQDNVFNTLEAKELLSLLHAIILIKKTNNLLNTILVNSLLGFNAKIIDKINKNKNLQANMIEKFITYHTFWENHGVLSMLHKIIKDHKIKKNFLNIDNNTQQLTNLLHLGEILQASSSKFSNKYQLLKWLSSQIQESNINIHHQLRLENNDNLIKIITIHKSKGLEFPLVFLPFAATFYITKHALFHDRKKYKKYLDLDKNPKNLILAEEERLSEDMRLLYVALTRSMYQCYIGIGTIIHRKHQINNNIHDLHLSAIGHLIQQGIPGDLTLLQKKINLLTQNSNGDIVLCPIESSKNLTIVQQQSKYIISKIKNKKWNTNIKNEIRHITSYTDLKKISTNKLINEKITLQTNEIKKNNTKQTNNITLTSHNFPRGHMPGIFLHKLLANVHFTKNLNQQWLSSQMKKNNIDNIWLTFITQWIQCILHTPLQKTQVTLEHLTNNDKHTELKFIFPINIIKTSQNIDELCKFYDPLSQCCPALTLPCIKGMLKGSIDLVFRHKQRYYILDYKSNWLGKSNTYYSSTRIKKEIILHRYELQYQLYTLAVHKFLCQKLPNYTYQKNFGGIFFLFIRGINTIPSKHGIYFCRPKKELIHELNVLFTK